MIFDRDKVDQGELPPALPFIFPKHEYSQQQSQKSLYKNDSESSHHTINPENMQLHLDKSQRQGLNPKHSFVSNDLQNSASIKKYLKKGDEFNKFNAQKIFKIDNGLEENALKNYLYKIPKDYSINRFPPDLQIRQKSNEKSLKEIYVSSTKSKKHNQARLDKLSNRTSKRFSTMTKMSQPQHAKQLVSQQVQTEKPKITAKPKIKPHEKTTIKTSPRMNTFEVLEKSKTQKLKNQKSNLNLSKFINLSSILEKDEEEIQPPKKLTSIRQNHFQTKYLINQSFTGQQSTAPSTYTNTYLSSMSKLSSNFNSQIQKIKKARYDFSQASQKISPEKYSRTIDAASNFQKNQLQQSSPRDKDFQPELPRSVKAQNPVKNQPKSQEARIKKGSDVSIQVQEKQMKITKIKDKENESVEEEKKAMSLSVVPEQSQTMNSAHSQSVFEPFSALSIVNQEREDKSNHENQSENHKYNFQPQERKQSQVSKKEKPRKKVDEMMQFPEISELRISPMQKCDEKIHRKTIHPIRNNFNEKGINWITDSYHPKSKILEFINVEKFVIKKYRNGVFFGELENDKKHGTGVIFYYNGKIFEGKFLGDLKDGEGYEEFPDGSKFQGQFKSGVKCGKGTFQWSNGEVYEGEWFNGKKHGSGIWKSSEGQSYIGEWNNGKAQGFGVYISKLGDRYEGEFQNSQKQGFGTQRYNNGETYVGEYRRNRPNGQGEYFWANGNYYKGQFVNHLRHGQGYFKDMRTGEEYKGEYRNDKKCGFGQLKQGNTNYVGNLQNDYKHGYGEFYEAEYCRFKGYWVNGNFLDQDQEHQDNCPEGKGKFQSIHEKPQLENQKLNARINRMKTIGLMKVDQGRSSLAKSRSPNNKSIESHENNSLQKSNYKRSCGCARKH